MTDVLKSFLGMVNTILKEIRNLLDKREELSETDFEEMQKILIAIPKKLADFRLPAEKINDWVKSKLEPLQIKIDHAVSINLSRKENTSQRKATPRKLLHAAPQTKPDRYHSYEERYPRGVSPDDITAQAATKGKEGNYIRVIQPYDGPNKRIKPGKGGKN